MTCHHPKPAHEQILSARMRLALADALNTPLSRQPREEWWHGPSGAHRRYVVNLLRNRGLIELDTVSDPSGCTATPTAAARG